MCPMSVWFYLRLSVACISKWRFPDAKQISAPSWQIKSYRILSSGSNRAFWSDKRHKRWYDHTGTFLLYVSLCLTGVLITYSHQIWHSVVQLGWASHVINITGPTVCVGKLCGLRCLPWCPDAGWGTSRTRTRGLCPRHTHSPVLTHDYAMVRYCTFRCASLYFEWKWRWTRLKTLFGLMPAYQQPE